MSEKEQKRDLKECLQISYILFPGLANFLLAIAAFTISGVVQKRLNNDLDYLNFYSDQMQTILSVMWVLSCFCLFFGLIVMIGACKLSYNTYNNSNAYLIFPISIFVCSLVQGIYIFQFKNQILLIIENYYIPDWSQDLESAVLWAKSEFCQSDCQCYIKNNDLALIYGLQNYTLIPSSVINVQKCPGIKDNFYKKQVAFLSFAEKSYQCAGWYQHNKYYLFSDINNNIPETHTQGCYKDTLYYIDNNFFIIGVFSYVVMGFQAFFLLTFFMSHCCQCHYRNKQRKVEYKQERERERERERQKEIEREREREREREKEKEREREKQKQLEIEYRAFLYNKR